MQMLKFVASRLVQGLALGGEVGFGDKEGLRSAGAGGFAGGIYD